MLRTPRHLRTRGLRLERLEDRLVLSFQPARNFPVGLQPYWTALGDFDLDGDVDIAAVNFAGNSVSVLMNNGDGTSFAAAVNRPVGQQPTGVVAADLDYDGDTDLVTANSASNDLSVLLNNGDGTFAEAVSYPVENGPNWVDAADVNLDGYLDLVSSNFANASVSVRFNDPKAPGTFADPTHYPVGTQPGAGVLSDLDLDGDLDLVVPSLQNNSLSFLFNNGDGTFLDAVDIVLGDQPIALAAGDVDGDYYPDLVIANYSNAGGVIVTLTSTFDAVPYTMGSRTDAVRLVDVDLDGDLDLVASNDGSDNVSVRLNDGTGTFGDVTQLASGLAPGGLSTGDLNGDYYPDLVTANLVSNNVSVFLNDALWTGPGGAPGGGSGYFLPPTIEESAAPPLPADAVVPSHTAPVTVTPTERAPLTGVGQTAEPRWLSARAVALWLELTDELGGL